MSQEERYRVIQPQDEEGFDLTTEEDRTRHLIARNGDHLMIPFQCELCHFRNLKGCDPRNVKEDILLIRTIRRANVDAFWSREPGTVEATRRESRQILVVGNRLGLENVLPAMGPFPLTDTQGMGIAVSILLRSLDKGRYQNTLQYESVRKMRSAFSNVWHASCNTLTTSVLARDVRKTYVTSCPAYSLWFERFMIGMHKRMGDEVRQDKAVTLAVIHKLMEGLEEEYLGSRTEEERGELADMSVFILASFLAALRGEETLKISLGETRDYYAEAENNIKHKHIVLPLRGRFKGENGEGYHFVAVSALTDSGLKIGPWVKRAIVLKENQGRVKGFLFSSRGEKRMKLKDLDGGILDRLAKVQRFFPDLISPAVDVHEEYGLSRSFRRGSTSEAINRGVTDSEVDRNNRWRKEERAGARKAKLRMRDHYSEVLVSLGSYLKYSQAL